MSVEIIIVAPTAVATIWPIVEPLLAKSIDMMKGCYLPEDVCAACQMGIWQPGGMQLLIAAEGEEVLAAYCIEVANFPRRRVVRVAFAGGIPHTMAKWLELMIKAIDDNARQIGCTAILAAGRKGWARLVEGEEVGTILWRDYPAMELHS